VGDCIINSPNETSPSRTSCSSPHDAEVFATIALPKGPWPGTATVQQVIGGRTASRSAFLQVENAPVPTTCGESKRVPFGGIPCRMAVVAITQLDRIDPGASIHRVAFAPWQRSVQ